MMRLPVNEILLGDALSQLRSLPTSSVDCIVTSPPYYGLRNYAADGQLGLEPSVHEWVSELVAIAAELARVLQPHGSMWLNLGDSYSRRVRHGAPPKGLLLAPERLLLQLSEQGWIVRNKVVWAKPNAMPASVEDRLTASWEPLYFLVRSRRYHFDLDAIREPHTSGPRAKRRAPVASAPPRWAGPLAGNQIGLDRLHARGLVGHPLGRNPRDVWRIPTSGRRDDHHAAYPEALIERPIRATCPERVCTRCGLPWEQPHPPPKKEPPTGVRPMCGCRAASRRGIVLDPFIGSGTTAVVAERLGRNWVGIELQPRFVDLAWKRIRQARSVEKHAA